MLRTKIVRLNPVGRPGRAKRAHDQANSLEVPGRSLQRTELCHICERFRGSLLKGKLSRSWRHRGLDRVSRIVHDMVCCNLITAGIALAYFSIHKKSLSRVSCLSSLVCPLGLKTWMIQMMHADITSHGRIVLKGKPADQKSLKVQGHVTELQDWKASFCMHIIIFMFNAGETS